MNWVSSDIAIGNYQEAADADLLRREGIRSLLCLDRVHAKAKAEQLGLQVTELVHLEDGPGNDRRTLERAIESLARLLKKAPPVLVHCHAGRSRSVIVTAAYLWRHKGMTTKDALALVSAKRECQISAGLTDLLQRWVDEDEAS